MMKTTKTTTQKADATAEARDEGIGRYELIRQRNNAEAQRDELQRKLDDITEAYTALRSDSVVITNQRDELLAALQRIDFVAQSEIVRKIASAAIADAERGSK